MSGKLAPAGGLAVADGEDAVGEDLAQPVQPVLEPARARWIAASVLHDPFLISPIVRTLR